MLYQFIGSVSKLSTRKQPYYRLGKQLSFFTICIFFASTIAEVIQKFRRSPTSGNAVTNIFLSNSVPLPNPEVIPIFRCRHFAKYSFSGLTTLSNLLVFQGGSCKGTSRTMSLFRTSTLNPKLSTVSWS